MSEQEEAMVLRVCQAIDGAFSHDDLSWEKCARAAIKALIEPTKAMQNCSENIHWGYSCHVCGGLQDGYQRMLKFAAEQPV